METARPQDNSATKGIQPGARTGPLRTAPAGWASALGAIVFLFGILLTATHANEWMKQAVIAGATPASQQLPAADCPEDELEEEGISLAECEHLVSRMQGLVLSTPSWFPGTFIFISALGTIIAIASIVAGAALVDGRSWAPRAATAILAALAAIDVAGFIAVLNAGPILRDIYLWSIVVWFALHLALTVASIAGHDSDAAAEPQVVRG